MTFSSLDDFANVLIHDEEVVQLHDQDNIGDSSAAQFARARKILALFVDAPDQWLSPQYFTRILYTSGCPVWGSKIRIVKSLSGLRLNGLIERARDAEQLPKYRVTTKGLMFHHAGLLSGIWEAR